MPLLEQPFPPAVDGYAAAASAGLLPVVPGSAPALLPGETAGAAATRVAWAAIGWIVAGFLSTMIASQLGGAGGLLVAGVGFGGLGWLATIWAAVGRRNMAELRAGYTTLELVMGRFGGFAPKRFPGSWHRVPWDYRGVWRLSEAGASERAPDRDVIPPGLYPSPSRPDKWELWTGLVWANEFHEPPRG